MSSIVVMLLCYHVGFLLSSVIIVNTASIFVINLHGKYVFFSAVSMRYRCGRTPRMVSPKGGVM